MNKRFLRLALVMGLVVTNVSLAFAGEVKNNSVQSNVPKTSQVLMNSASISSDRQSVKYTDFLKNGGGEQWVKLDLKGANFTTKDPYAISDAITQNYDVETTLGVHPNGTTLDFGVYAPNANIEYINNWEITIDSSVLNVDQDLTIKIPVVKDMANALTPKVITSKTSVTRAELKNGFDITLEGINGAKFNTSCLANEVRVSMIKTANFGIEPLPYCNQISPSKIKFHIKQLNSVPSYVNTLEFRIEGNATNSPVPLIVKIPIVK